MTDGALREAIERARAGDWHAAHALVQRHEGDAIADWIHAILHRIEGDAANARYWYAEAKRPHRDADPAEELAEAAAALAARSH